MYAASCAACNEAAGHRDLMLVLGIESSCDDCAAAVVGDGPRLLGQCINSQVAVHAPFGGVVPELASRDHVRHVTVVIKQALQRARRRLTDIDGVAVTTGPGLIGSLLVGVTAARTLAWGRGLPIVGVEHLEAHLNAVFLQRPDLSYPFLGVVVSGGHTSIIRVDGLGKLQVLGRTRDDAAGEAFDKVAKLLGLGYPGGVSIERQAGTGNPAAIAFPRPLPGRRLDFSFSGLKTAALVWVKKYGLPRNQALADFAASFQEAVVDTLVRKTILAARGQRLRQVVVAGGVAANRRLRAKLLHRAAGEHLEVTFPPVELCTDNAAMVATLGHACLRAGRRDDVLRLDADAGRGWSD